MTKRNAAASDLSPEASGRANSAEPPAAIDLLEEGGEARFREAYGHLLPIAQLFSLLDTARASRSSDAAGERLERVTLQADQAISEVAKLRKLHAGELASSVSDFLYQLQELAESNAPCDWETITEMDSFEVLSESLRTTGINFPGPEIEED